MQNQEEILIQADGKTLLRVGGTDNNFSGNSLAELLFRRLVVAYRSAEKLDYAAFRKETSQASKALGVVRDRFNDRRDHESSRGVETYTEALCDSHCVPVLLLRKENDRLWLEVPLGKADPIVVRGGQDSLADNDPIQKPQHGCFGREKVLERVRTCLIGATPKPVLLYGPPGIGKSTIKREALRDRSVVRRFGERRYWVGGERAYTSEVLVQLMADALEIEGLDANPERARQQVLGWLKKRRTPIAIGIDNLETPLGMSALFEGASAPDPEDAERTRAFLQDVGEVPEVALIASFRAEARSEAGMFWEGVHVDSLADEPAADLFLSVAKLEPAPSRAEVLKLVREVEAVPLAIVLLAHQAEVEGSFAQFQNRWEKLEQGRGRTNSWKKALAFSLESPYLQSRPTASRLVLVMGLLPNGVLKTDAPSILNISESEAQQAGEALVKLGLVQNSRGGNRWKMLLPISEYLRDNLPPKSEDGGRADAFYLGLLESEGQGLSKKAEAVTRLVPEVGNIAAGLLRHLDEPRIRRALNDWYGYLVYISNSGSMEPLEAVAAKIGNPDDANDAANCLFRLGEINVSKSELDEAERRYNEAIPIYQSAGAKLGEANCLYNLGDVRSRGRHWEQAQFFYEAALPVYQSASDVMGEANIRERLAVLAWNLGELETAKAELLQARERWEAFQLPQPIAYIYYLLSCFPDTPETQRSYRRQAEKIAQECLDMQQWEGILKEIEALLPEGTPVREL